MCNKKLLKSLDKRTNALNIISSLKQTDGMVPYDGDYSNGDHDFRWFYVTTREEYLALIRSFTREPLWTHGIIKMSLESAPVLPDWFCVEADDGGIDFNDEDMDFEGPITITSLKKVKDAFRRFLSCF